MKLAELKEIAKARGLPSSGNKAALIQTIANASPTPSGGGKAKAAPQPTKPGNTEVRVGVQLDSATVAAMGLKLTGASTDMNGQPEYVYTKIGAAKASSSVRVSAGGISKGAIDKKGKKQKVEKKATPGASLKKVSDEALAEAVGCFVERLDEKKVPVELCRQFLKHFLDDDEIPKQKMKVFEKLGEQTHYETASDDSDDEEEDDE